MQLLLFWMELPRKVMLSNLKWHHFNDYRFLVCLIHIHQYSFPFLYTKHHLLQWCILYLCELALMNGNFYKLLIPTNLHICNLNLMIYKIQVQLYRWICDCKLYPTLILHNLYSLRVYESQLFQGLYHLQKLMLLLKHKIL